MVREVQYFGAFTRVKVDVGRRAAAGRPARRCPATPLAAPGEAVHLHWDDGAVHALDADGAREHRAGACPRPRCGLQRRISDLLYTRRGLLLLALLAPPLLWFGVIYLGSLFALLANAFFGLDDFTGQVVREFTLKNFVDLADPANLDVARRSVTMAVAGHAGLHRARLSAGLLHGAPCHRRAEGGALHRGDAAAVVELPGAAVRLEAAAGEGRRDLLAGAAARTLAGCSTRCCRCRRSAGRA